MILDWIIKDVLFCILRKLGPIYYCYWSFLAWFLFLPYLSFERSFSYYFYINYKTNKQYIFKDANHQSQNNCFSKLQEIYRLNSVISFNFNSSQIIIKRSFVQFKVSKRSNHQFQIPILSHFQTKINSLQSVSQFLFINNRMDIGISQLYKEQVDHLCLDRIKLQRKRMEHLLEVIKDLTFKNKELVKQNTLLKQQIQDGRLCKRSFDDISAQGKLIVQKNLMLEGQLHRYNETMLQQELLMNRLQQELNYNQSKEIYSRQSHFTQRNFKNDHSHDQSATSKDFEILKAQYKGLQKQYSKLYQNYYWREKLNSDAPGQISQNKLQRESAIKVESLKKTISYKNLEQTHINNETINYLKLREKYQKIKRQKKQLLKAFPLLQNEISGLKMRQRNLIELVDILKQKRTKVCVCHINKLEKQLELKAKLLQNRVNNN